MNLIYAFIFGIMATLFFLIAWNAIDIALTKREIDREMARRELNRVRFEKISKEIENLK